MYYLKFTARLQEGKPSRRLFFQVVEKGRKSHQKALTSENLSVNDGFLVC
jgi:hypothetical protein